MNQSKIETCLLDIIDTIKIWGCDKYNIPFLLIKTDWTFSKRYRSSFCQGSFLKYRLFFALDFTAQISTIPYKVLFEECNKISQKDPITANFYGNWKQHLKTLVCHEMAHIFDTSAREEHIIPSKICNYYNIPIPRKKRYHHHNALWHKIYRDLKYNFM